MGIGLPYYKPLTRAEVEQIDQTGRRILERIGIRINDSTYLDRLKSAGALVDYEEQRVRFQVDWLDEVLSHAPSRFTLYSRDGRNNLDLGGGRVYFANGGRVFRILDMRTGGYRLTMLRDVANTATLVEHMDYIRFYVIACQVHDLASQNYHLNDFYHAFNHTTKHVMGGCDNLEGARQMWELASLIAGGEDRLREKPFVSAITNPISPLTIEVNTLDVLNFCVTHGIPVICAPAPIAGATAPASLAGTLAQMHAEALAGVAITQVLSPGAKVVYSTVPMTMDLRNMELAVGSVEMAMMNAAAVQLGKNYNLPVCASGGLTEAKRPDIQAGVEKSISNLTVAMAGADCIRLAAGILDSGNSISYEQYVIDNEIIGIVHRLLTGIKVTKETLGFDVIEKVGPGGNYVMEDHTVEHMMDEFFYPELSVRYNFDVWEAKGRPDMLSRASDVVRSILREYRDGILDAGLISEIAKTNPGIQNI
ncbi:MAG TPA: trimethylamine methyltransferase [Chloroflexi bacterium]|nr:trimethylamine methyltransferase [Chloroflexota bacterium]